MPRKKAAKVVETEETEFDVDEPSEVEELANNATDDEWTPADDEKKPGRPQRAVRNKKPLKIIDGGSDEPTSEEEEEEDRGGKRKRGGGRSRGGGGRGRGRGGGAAKRAKLDENGKGRGGKKKTEEGEDEEKEGGGGDEGGEDEESLSEEEESLEDSDTEDTDIPPEFKSGKFVVLKSDFDKKKENYPIWKIDGKSLLQKFDKFVHKDEELYKGTTIYAGWSKNVISTYYPIDIETKTLDTGENTVKFDTTQIKSEPADYSDEDAEGAGGGETEPAGEEEEGGEDEEEEEDEEDEEAEGAEEDEEGEGGEDEEEEEEEGGDEEEGKK